VIGLAISLALSSAASQGVDAEGRARQFLEAFAVSPKAAKQFTTKDAAVIVGDIGGTFDDYAKVMRRHPNALKACQVGELKWKQDLSAVEQNDPDLDPRLKTGRIRAFDGSFSCPHAEGSKAIEYTVVLRDDLVVEFFLGNGR
jgi:hypothetical protein